jgi:alkaline phosphatase D
MNDRRKLLKSLAAAGGVALLPRVLRAAAPPPLPEYPFKLGVASGFPLHRSVKLWTRLAPQPDLADGGLPPVDIPVRFEVASDDRFRRIVTRGEASAVARLAHSVHLQAIDLEPSRDYWYRFFAGDHVSATGRTRTTPQPTDRVDSLRIVAACCQNYEHGHFAALRHLAAEAPDLVLHLGDYIYEGAPSTNRVRRHTGNRCVTLDDYRRRYALYLSDPALQAAHAAAPWYFTWDDHEVANDYAGVTPGRAEDPAAFQARRAAAYQAWYEHLPVSAYPSMGIVDGKMGIHMKQELGQLVTLHMLDQRQYRSPEACPRPPQLGGLRVGDECAELREPARTMLGTDQELWLASQLKVLRTGWSLFGQGTPFGHMREGTVEKPEYWTDAWTGYPAARQRLLDSLQQARPANHVILSGDIHAFLVRGINAVPERFDTPLVASEFVTTSISSDPVAAATLERWRSLNPQLQRLDGSRRGYLSLTLSPKQLRTDLVTVDDASRPDAARSVSASYVVEAGNPAIHPA